MTKKRKRYPDLNQKLERPWCFYCERDFDDLKILISHQKAKHFKCDRCGRRLNTAGGLSVHMNQVHKENLSHVENAIPGRQGLEIEIFGMEGVPGDIVDQHNQQVTQKHFAEEAERQRRTGNPARGALANGETALNKRARVHETVIEIEFKADKYRVDRANGVLPLPVAEIKPEPTPPAVQPFGAPPATAAPPFQPGQQFQSAYPPARPGSIPGGSGLPQRPGFGAPPAAFPANGAAPGAEAISASLDDLIADVNKAPAAEAPAEKKSKKDKNVKLVFFHDSISPEEKMALLPRYGEFMRS